MERAQIVNAVQLRIDDVITDNAIQVITNPYIDQMLDSELINVFKTLPAKFLPQKSIAGTPTEVQSGLYKIVLPEDYLRIVQFKTENLTRPLTESDLVGEGSRDHIFMYHPYVSGGNSRPRGCVVKSGSVKALTYNSTATGTVENSFYIAFPTYDDVTAEIIDPVAWFIAASVLQIIGETDASNNAMKKVTEFLIKNQ